MTIQEIGKTLAKQNPTMDTANWKLSQKLPWRIWKTLFEDVPKNYPYLQLVKNESQHCDSLMHLLERFDHDVLTDAERKRIYWSFKNAHPDMKLPMGFCLPVALRCPGRADREVDCPWAITDAYNEQWCAYTWDLEYFRNRSRSQSQRSVSYTHLRAHETP